MTKLNADISVTEELGVSFSFPQEKALYSGDNKELCDVDDLKLYGNEKGRLLKVEAEVAPQIIISLS